MRGVGTVDSGQPEAVNHLFGGEIAPTAIDVAFVLDFVVEDGLAPGGAPFRCFFEVVALQARVCDPGFGVVVDGTGVMDGAEMGVRVFGYRDTEEAVPI